MENKNFPFPNDKVLITIDEVLRSPPRLQKPRSLPELQRLLEG
jgi:hypothetical protein